MWFRRSFFQATPFLHRLIHSFKYRYNTTKHQFLFSMADGRKHWSTSHHFNWSIPRLQILIMQLDYSQPGPRGASGRTHERLSDIVAAHLPAASQRFPRGILWRRIQRAPRMPRRRSTSTKRQLSTMPDDRGRECGDRESRASKVWTNLFQCNCD